VTATGETSGSIADASFLVRTNWPRYHFDNANTGYNPYENVISQDNVGTLVQKWAFSTGASGTPGPIVAYGRVYVAPTDGVVRALDPATGSLLWSFDTGGTMSGAAPTAANDLIYVGNHDGVLYALSASTGTRVWARDLGVSMSDSPVVSVGALYVDVLTRSSYFMFSIDPLTGSTNWFTDQALWDVPPPTLAYGLVFDGGSLSCGAQAIDATTGTEAWVVELCDDAEPSDAFAAANGLVFEGDDGGTHAVDPATGDTVWSAAAVGWVAPSVANGVVYVGSNAVYAMNARTGTLLWSSAAPGRATSPPIVANGVVYMGLPTLGYSGKVWAFGVDDGASLWTSPLNSSFFGAVAISDGVLYAATSAGTVYAYGLP
jgi:outer membrane protein assembly factor BamB